MVFYMIICRSFGGKWGSRYSLWCEWAEELCAESLRDWWDGAGFQTVPTGLKCPCGSGWGGGVAAHAPIAINYKQISWLNDSIKGMLKERRRWWCSALLSWDQSLLGWWPPQVWLPTFPPGNPAAALRSITPRTWWQLIRALHVLFFKVFILCSTFFCCLI